MNLRVLPCRGRRALPCRRRRALPRRSLRNMRLRAAGDKMLAGLYFVKEAFLRVIVVVEDILLRGELQLHARRNLELVHINGQDGLVFGQGKVDFPPAMR